MFCKISSFIVYSFLKSENAKVYVKSKLTLWFNLFLVVLWLSVPVRLTLLSSFQAFKVLTLKYAGIHSAQAGNYFMINDNVRTWSALTSILSQSVLIIRKNKATLQRSSTLSMHGEQAVAIYFYKLTKNFKISCQNATEDTNRLIWGQRSSKQGFWSASRLLEAWKYISSLSSLKWTHFQFAR